MMRKSQKEDIPFEEWKVKLRLWQHILHFKAFPARVLP